jgi:hypothetical protein
MQKICSNCGKPLKNLKGRKKDQKHFFCTRQCYYDYLKNNKNIKGNFICKSKQLKKIEKLARMRKEMLG